jgi:hypothetical protein
MPVTWAHPTEVLISLSSSFLQYLTTQLCQCLKFLEISYFKCLDSSNTSASFLLRHVYSISKFCPNICNLTAFGCPIEILEIIRTPTLTLNLAKVLLLDGLRRLVPSVGILLYEYSTESLFCYIICYIQYTNFRYYNFVYSYCYFHYAYLFFHALYLWLVIPYVFCVFFCCQCNGLLAFVSAS